MQKELRVFIRGKPTIDNDCRQVTLCLDTEKRSFECRQQELLADALRTAIKGYFADSNNKKGYDDWVTNGKPDICGNKKEIDDEKERIAS
jgi:hypothetical protein